MRLRKVSRRARPVRLSALVSLIALAPLLGGAAAEHPAATYPPWAAGEAEIEEILSFGQVVHRERIGHGVTRPFKVVLEHEGTRLEAIWKPLGNRHFDRRESYQAEVAAYRLSRALGLDMVPPTVERKIDGRWGSLQMWIDGFEPYSELLDEQPPALLWSRQMARMNFFDELIENPDRNAGNFLVDPSWHVVLIDHSRALAFEGRANGRQQQPPRQFDRRLVERARELDHEMLDELLGDILPRHDRTELLRQRDLLLAHVERLEAKHGEYVFFD